MTNNELIKLGLTKTYTEIADIAGKEPHTMHMYLKRHNIKFVLKKNNKPKTVDNGVIKSRFKKGCKALEYWLSVRAESGGFMYNGWYSLSDFKGDTIPECDLQPATLGARIKQIVAGDSEYNTLWDAAIAPSRQNKILKPDIEPSFEWACELMRPGSLAGTIR
jgi:hypothetical protein